MRIRGDVDLLPADEGRFRSRILARLPDIEIVFC